MSAALPPVPAGNGKHPILMVALSANNLSASMAFYRDVFGWELASLSSELASASLPAGPFVTLRANTPAGFQGVVPFVTVGNVQAAVDAAVAAGAAIERSPWPAPMIGTLARVTAPGGTVYGLCTAISPTKPDHQPAPFGEAPRPPVNTICSLEMHGPDLDATARFVESQFGWGTLPTMPQYCMFDAGAGIGGVFQSHTPATRGLAYIYVADVASTLAKIDAAGGKRMGEPMAVPGLTTFGYFTDPSGTAMGLMG